MNEQDSSAVVIAALARQVELSSTYIRRYMAADPNIDGEFLTDFADACQAVLEKATVPSVIEEYELLRNLREWVRPYFNYLFVTGERDRVIEEEIRKLLVLLFSEEHVQPIS